MQIRNNVDYTTRDYEGFRNDMIELLKKKVPEYSDFSQSDMGIVLIELLAHGLDILSYYNDRVANEIFPETALERESIIKHCRRLGYELKHSVPSQYYQVFKIVPQDTDYVIPKGTELYTNGDDKIEFELIEDLTIPKGCNGLEKDREGNYLYKAIVEHGTSINSDIIGSSNGTQYQEFTLSYAPVIVDSLKVYVSDEFNIDEWERVSNFIESDNTSKQYMTETTEADTVKIMFGSGVSGAIPPVYEDGISASYRVGGGHEGNVSLETITEMSSKPAVIIDTMNIEQIQVGKDKESIAEARINAPLSLKTLWRAVSLEDYANLLLQEYVGEVINCKAIAEEDRYTVSVYVQTKEPFTEELKAKYFAFLDERKEIGYNLQIFPPTYKDVNLNVRIVTNKAYKNSYVQGIVKSKLEDMFTVGNYSFGEPLLVSSVIKEVMNLPGVYDVSIDAPGYSAPNEHSIIRVGTINVNVSGGV